MGGMDGNDSCALLRRAARKLILLITNNREQQPEPQLARTTNTQNQQTKDLIQRTQSLLNHDAQEALPKQEKQRHDMIRRFLIARNYDTKRAAAFLDKHLAWREANLVDQRRHQSAESILGCDLVHMQTILPHATGGTDRHGRLLVYLHFGGQCELRKLLKHTKIENLMAYCWWLSESYVRKLDQLGTDQWCSIIDAKGWHLGLFDGTAVRFLQGMHKIWSDHYPERLNRLIVVNAPATLAIAWKVIRTWLDDKTRHKIEIVSSRDLPQAVRSLSALAEASQLAEQYGGTGPRLCPWPVCPSHGGLSLVTS